MSDDNAQIGEILVRRNLITRAQLDEALAEQARSGTPKPIVSHLAEKGLLDETDALRALSEQFGVPGIDLRQVAIATAHLDAVPVDVARASRILPVLVKEDSLFVAMANPLDKRALDELEFVTGKKVYPYVAIAGALDKVTKDAFKAKASGEAYYLGPNVPDATLQQLGFKPRAHAPPPVAPAPPPPAPVASAPAAPAAPPAPEPRAPEARAAVAQPRAPTLPEPKASPVEPSKPKAVPRPNVAPPAPPKRPAAPGKVVKADSLPPTQRVPSMFDAARSAVVVDEAVSRSSEKMEISVAEIGHMDEEVSTVSRLPDELKPTAPKPGTASKGGGKGDGKLILLVDDEEDIRKLLRRLLIEQGHRVIEADRGLLALRMVKEYTPDLIVLDAMLPELHGFDIAKRIRGSEKYGSIPIIMVSAVYRGRGIAQDLKANYGIEEYIEKPFRIQDIAASVQRLLNERTKRESERPPRNPEDIKAEAEQLLQQGVAAYKAGHLEQAIDLLKRGVGIDPLAYRLRYHLALLYAKQGQIFEGISELEQAVELNPKHFPALKNLAVLYEKAGFRHKALEVWERCAQNAPDAATKAQLDEHTRALRKG